MPRLSASALIGRARKRAAFARARLFRRFVAGMSRPLRLVDLGGSFEMWRRWGITEADGLDIVLVNNHDYDTSNRGQRSPLGRELIADVRSLRAADYRDYDVVFSNSMLEHLYTREAQAAVAAEVMASGKPFFIQVPNRRCLVDPHFPHPLAPFFAAWPRSLQLRGLLLFPIDGGRRAPSMELARKRVHNYVPLARDDLAALFPGAELRIEWSLLLPMSLVAMRR